MLKIILMLPTFREIFPEYLPISATLGRYSKLSEGFLSFWRIRDRNPGKIRELKGDTQQESGATNFAFTVVKTPYGGKIILSGSLYPER